MRFISVIILSIIANNFGLAQISQSIQWQGCYGGTDVDYATDIVEADNGYLVIGTVKSNDGDISNNHGDWDIWIANIDSIGNLLWERCYGGSSNDSQGRIIKDFEGNYYFCGSVGSDDGDIQSGNHGDFDTWIVKIDATGEIIWEKCYGGSGREEAPYLKLLSNGNILISSKSTSDDGDLPAHYGAFDAWLFVISPEGEILKSAVFGNDMHNGIYDIIKTQDEGYFFTCEASSTEGMVEGNYHGGLTDVWVVKLDSNMNIEWQMLYGGSETDYSLYGILELQDGYLFLAQTNSNDGDVSGFHGSPGESTDIWAVRIDLEGNIIWQRCLGGWDWEFSGSLHQTEDDGFIIFAETDSHGGDVSGNNSWQGNSDIWIVKLDEQLDIIWQNCIGGYESDTPKYITETEDGGYLVVGNTISNSGDVSGNHSLAGVYTDIWVVKLNHSGEIEWQQCYGGWGREKLESPHTILKKGDYNYVIAATTNYGPSYDVACTPTGGNETDKDAWIFEIDMEDTTNIIGKPAMEDRIKVYPNPARDYVVFELDIQGLNIKTLDNKGELKIKNVFGQEVSKISFNSETTIWDIKGIKSGIYFYSTFINKKNISGKIIIE